jgi:O-antigen/teichoic acid export membrane protein
LTRLSKNILYNLTGQGILVFLGLLAVKYVFRQLGEDALGIIYFALALNTMLTVTLAMGIGDTLVREVSSHLADDPDYIRDLLRTASLFSWATYLVFAVAIYAAAPVLIERWINLKTLDQALAIRVLRTLGIAAFVALPRTFCVSILRGLERMELNNLIDIATAVLQQVGIILVLLRGGGLLRVVDWIAACFVFSIVAYLAVCARFIPPKGLIPGISASVIRRNLCYTSNSASISMLAMVQTQADKAIVSKLLPVGVFGFYSVAYGAISRATLITGAVFHAAFPHFSRLFKDNDRPGLALQYRKLQDLLCFAMLPIFAAIPFFATPVFGYLLNAEAARMLLLPTTILGIGFYMNGTLNIPYAFSLAVGRPDIAARANLYALFIVLPVTLGLVYLFGMNGAAVSWVVYHLFLYAVQLPPTCRECIEVDVSCWFRHLFKPVSVGFVIYGTAWAVQNTLISAAIAYVVASAVFLGVAYLLIGDGLRQSLHQASFFFPRKIQASQPAA